MTATNLPKSTHHDISHNYGCPATMTVAYFVIAGLVHRAVRFWRQDMPSTGQIEVYTYEPYPGSDYTMTTELGWYDTAFGTDMLGYVDEQRLSRTDMAAMIAIGLAKDPGYSLDSGLARTAMLEMV